MTGLLLKALFLHVLCLGWGVFHCMMNSWLHYGMNLTCVYSLNPSWIWEVETFIIPHLMDKETGAQSLRRRKSDPWQPCAGLALTAGLVVSLPEHKQFHRIHCHSVTMVSKDTRQDPSVTILSPNQKEHCPHPPSGSDFLPPAWSEGWLGWLESALLF